VADKRVRGTAKSGWFGRLWREHEEGVLYAVAALIYIPAGVFLKTVVLNWMLGILFPLIVVYLIPKQIRRRRSNATATEPQAGS
jgi:uncharacterized membrane protein YfcA